MAWCAPSCTQAAHFSALPAVVITVAPQGTRELDGGHANAAAAPLNQQDLPGLQARTVKNIAPHGEEGLGQRGRLDVAQALRHWQALRHRGYAILRIAAARHKRAHAITTPQARLRQGIVIAFVNDAGHFQSRHVRGTRRWRVMALAL